MSWQGFVFMHRPTALDAVPAGELVLEESGVESLTSQFGYGRRYLARPDAIPVDPLSLPLTCLPGDELRYSPKQPPLFGAIRDAAPDFWGRRVIEAKLQLPPNGAAESVYLLNAGPHRFGALDFRPLRDSPPAEGLLPADTELEYLLEAADRIAEGLPVPGRLAAIFEVASVGGARPKAVINHGGRQYLAKFPTKTDGFDIPVVERACLELAREAGLDVPQTAWRKLGDGRTIMLIERFDREPRVAGLYRKHAVSALTLLGCHENQSLGTPYATLAQAISQYGVTGAIQTDRAELYGRIAFNILVSNDDDHLRNHAFLWDPAGQGWRLSPLFDVVPRPQLAHERNLHLSVGPRGRRATLDNLLAAHGDFGLLLPAAAAIIDRVAGVVREWQTFFEDLGVPGREIDRVATAFRRPRDIGLADVARALA